MKQAPGRDDGPCSSGRSRGTRLAALLNLDVCAILLDDGEGAWNGVVLSPSFEHRRPPPLELRSEFVLADVTFGFVFAGLLVVGRSVRLFSRHCGSFLSFAMRLSSFDWRVASTLAIG